MTDQERDRFIYKNETFGIVGVDGEGLFNPTNYGIKVIPISTACWRGYYCVYSIANNSLSLQEVYLGLDKEDERLIQQEKGVKLFGKTPRRYKYFASKVIEVDGKLKFSKTKEEFESWDFRCDRLNKLVKFTGGILIGCDAKSRVNTLLHNCDWVYELVFDSGRLIEAIDCSSRMSEFQNMLSSKQSNYSNRKKRREAEQWLKESFTWDYNL